MLSSVPPTYNQRDQNAMGCSPLSESDLKLDRAEYGIYSHPIDQDSVHVNRMASD